MIHQYKYFFFGIFCFSCVFATSVFAEPTYLYAREMMKNYLNTQNMLTANHKFIDSLSMPLIPSSFHTLGINNHDFIFSQLSDLQSFDDDAVRIDNFKSSTSFLELDIWEFLERSNSREEGYAQYLDMGKSLQNDVVGKNEFYTAEMSRLNSLIKQQKSDVKTLEKTYKNAVDEWDSDRILSLQIEIQNTTKELSFSETEYTKIKAYQERNEDLTSQLNKKLEAVEENKDALVKNVRINKTSGELIDAITE